MHARRVKLGCVVAALSFSAVAFAQAPAAKPSAPATKPAAPAEEQPAAAGNEVMVAPGKVELTWWGHAAFVLRTHGGAVLAIDPWFKNPKAPQGAKWPENVSAILVSHGHFDHVGNTVELANKTQAPVLGAFELVNQLGVKNGNGGNIGGSVRIQDATIHFVEAVHSSGMGEDPKAVKYGGAPMGFVIAVDGGPTLYFAGDTNVFSSMQLIQERFKPTLALLPIGGHFTMDPEGAAMAARLLGVKTVVPMHYGTFPVLTGTPKELETALPKAKAKAKVTNLAIGTPSQL